MTAELLKRKIGSVHPSVDRGTLTIYGRSLRSGLGAELTISSAAIREALAEKVEDIIETIKLTLEDTPPELSADIYDFGIMLAGGGAMLGGLPTLISERTGLRVTVAKRPLECVCLGIGRVIESAGAIGGALKTRSR